MSTTASAAEPQTPSTGAVDVIIPVHNGARTLGRALRSLMRQRPGTLGRIIVVDDASTDRTPAIARRYGAEVISHDVPQGPFRSRMDGLAASRSAWVTFLDADDWLDADALHKALRRATPDVDVVQMGVTWRLTPFHFRWERRRQHYRTGRILDAMLWDDRQFPVQMWGKLYRRTTLEDLRLPDYDGFWGEDRLFNLALVDQRRPRVAVVRGAVYNYRFGGASVSTDGRRMAEMRRVADIKAAAFPQYAQRIETEYRKFSIHDHRLRHQPPYSLKAIIKKIL